jgi:type IV pilus assembly protein PilC
MPKFSYQAITETGATTSGEIEADSLENANNLLASRGYIPTRNPGTTLTGKGT